MSGTKLRKPRQYDANRICDGSSDSKTEAIVCTRGRDGRPRFKTTESINLTLEAAVDWAPQYCAETNALAADILASVLANYPKQIVAKIMEVDTGKLYRQFSAEFLETMPLEGGTIPLHVIEEWLFWHYEAASVSHSEEPLPEDEPVIRGSYRWTDMPRFPFSTYGLICCRNPEGSPVYNIKQRIWLQQTVCMEWSEATQVAIETLAINVVNQFLDEHDPVDVIRRSLRGDLWSLYTPFVEDFLFAMPNTGGQIPVRAMMIWLKQLI